MMSLRRLAFAFALTGGAIFVACGGSDDTSVTNVAADGGAADGSIDNGDSGSGGDGSSSADSGGEITDGGANFGDGGSDDGGDFPDGGTCNRVGMGDSFMSDCSGVSPLDFGGALVAGTYKLTKVTDLGTFMFCSKSFTAVPFTGGLVVSAGSTPTSSQIELAIDGDDTGRKSFTWTVVPAGTNKSPLSITQTCPTPATFTLPYNSYAGGKQVFEFVGPYGSGGGTATYHFEKD